MVVFNKQKDNGQHSFIRLDYADGDIRPLIPHIFTSVGYWTSFILLGFYHNLLINRRNRLHTFFYEHNNFLQEAEKESCSATVKWSGYKYFATIVAFILFSTLSSKGQWYYNYRLDSGTMPQYVHAGPFMSKNECEASRSHLLASEGLDFSTIVDGGKNIKWEATPCVGPAQGNNFPVAGDLSYMNNYQLLGVEQGMSSFTSNPAEDISNWYREWMEKYENNISPYDFPNVIQVYTGDHSFDKKYYELASNEENFNTGYSGISYEKLKDKYFIPINANDKENLLTEFADNVLVNRYISQITDDMIDDIVAQLLDSGDWTMLSDYVIGLFASAAGIDISRFRDLLCKEYNLSDEEKQILFNFYGFKKKIYERIGNAADNKIKKSREGINKTELDMAILSQDCYKDSPSLLHDTDYISVTDEFFLQHPEWETTMGEVGEALKILNSQTNGFYAELYYNEITNEFSVAFRGTEVRYNDIITDLLQAQGKLTEQHGCAYTLAVLLKRAKDSGVKINITGHSLGGGLASVVGAFTGLPTYTYNAAGISDNSIRKYEELRRLDAGDTRPVTQDDIDKIKLQSQNNITAFCSSDDILTRVQDRDFAYLAKQYGPLILKKTITALGDIINPVSPTIKTINTINKFLSENEVDSLNDEVASQESGHNSTETLSEEIIESLVNYYIEKTDMTTIQGIINAANPQNLVTDIASDIASGIVDLACNANPAIGKKTILENAGTHSINSVIQKEFSLNADAQEQWLEAKRKQEKIKADIENEESKQTSKSKVTLITIKH